MRQAPPRPIAGKLVDYFLPTRSIIARGADLAHEIWPIAVISGRFSRFGLMIDSH
jgi:hypothetical protein